MTMDIYGDVLLSSPFLCKLLSLGETRSYGGNYFLSKSSTERSAEPYFSDILIHLLTVIELSPGGSTHLHTNDI
jgi:hypothetical protein